MRQLTKLWDGVPTVGVEGPFTLRGICMWTMHDYPGTLMKPFLDSHVVFSYMHVSVRLINILFYV